MTDLVFLDVETTGLDPDHDRIWEIAAIRRGRRTTTLRTGETIDLGPGPEYTLHLQLRHGGATLADDMPDHFRDDYQARYNHESAAPPLRAARLLADFLHGRPQIVGVNPAFDTDMVGRMMRRANMAPPWDHRLLDLPALTIGRLLAVGEQVTYPARSDDLSARVGIDTAAYDRHTAMGDVLWCIDWWHALQAPVI